MLSDVFNLTNLKISQLHEKHIFQYMGRMGMLHQTTPLKLIDLLHKSHNVPVPYPTMHHFVTEMCTQVHIFVTKRCIVGYLSNALWDLWDSSTFRHMGKGTISHEWTLENASFQYCHISCNMTLSVQFSPNFHDRHTIGGVKGSTRGAFCPLWDKPEMWNFTFMINAPT